MASVKLLLNRNRTLKSGSFPLVFQIIHRRQKKLIYTPFKLFPEEFDAQQQKIVPATHAPRSPKEIRSMNRTITGQLQNIEFHIAEMDRKSTDCTVADILFHYNIEHNPQSLLNCIDTQIRRKLELDKDSSLAAYRSTRASVAAFIGRKEVAINQVDGAFVRDYVRFLRNRNVCDNTVCYYIRNLKAMCNQAIGDGYRRAEDDPFRNLHIKPRKTVKRAVCQDTIRGIAELDLSQKPNLDLARDIFLFSFFARGMSFVDVIYLKKPKEVIQYSRKKTNQWLSITVTPQLAALIRKYENDTEYVFPILDSSQPQPLYKQYRLALERTNRNLKAVGRKLELETTLTTYVARHSWATGAKKIGAPISAISEGLGHTSERTTQIYLGELDQSVLDRLNKQVTEL